MTSALDPTAPPALVRAPVLVAGEELDVAEWLPVVNPVRTSEVAGEVALGGAGHVDRTVQAAHRAFPPGPRCTRGRGPTGWPP
ncbi:MAG: hypothetical protein JWR62_1209, partial [Modestobacter sp.]|nr:hypothetical protein [Modestobacter sp.]